MQQNMVPLVRCITSKKIPESGRSSSSPCQLLDFAFQLPPPVHHHCQWGGTRTRGIKLIPCATVEVYNSETSQWYTADPLPAPRGTMTSITIADTCYLLGGCDADAKAIAAILYASLTSFVQKATSPTLQSASHTSVSPAPHLLGLLQLARVDTW